VPADTLAGLCFQAFVDFDGLLDESAEFVRKRIDRDQSGGVPSRPCRQFSALEQAGICPAAVRKTVQHVDADTAATDNNNPGM